MSRLDRVVPLESVILSDRQREAIDDLISEWRSGDQLRKAGIPLRQRLLFHGPPGCGKTLTALAIANKIGLPAFVVRFDALVGAFLGQTAVNLRQVFRFAETQPCVLLLDELDALGRKRGNAQDVGELDRVVISLMQELDHSSPLGMVIATTNLPAQIDQALWRRFDLDVRFPRPSHQQLLRQAVAVARTRGIVVTPDLRKHIKRAKSFADLERLMNDRARRAVLARIAKSKGRNGQVE